MNELLILVDENDNEIGYEEKMKTHVEEYLHRAFSLFIYDKANKKILIHKRAKNKYHSGGLWTNSCCSHPRKGEDLEQAVIRRANEELGIELNKYCNVGELIEVGSFKYYKKYPGCAEHEIDHVFIALISDSVPINFDSNEINAIKWISVKELEQCVKESRDSFTAWFPNAFELFVNYIERL